MYKIKLNNMLSTLYLKNRKIKLIKVGIYLAKTLIVYNKSKNKNNNT